MLGILNRILEFPTLAQCNACQLAKRIWQVSHIRPLEKSLGCRWASYRCLGGVRQSRELFVVATSKVMGLNSVTECLDLERDVLALAKRRSATEPGHPEVDVVADLLADDEAESVPQAIDLAAVAAWSIGLGPYICHGASLSSFSA